MKHVTIVTCNMRPQTLTYSYKITKKTKEFIVICMANKIVLKVIIKGEACSAASFQHNKRELTLVVGKACLYYEKSQ